jgi:hypothetical protein
LKSSTGIEHTILSASQPAVLKPAYRLAGFCALWSGLLLLVAFLIPGQDLAQLLIFSISPLVLLPAIPALNRVFRDLSPDLSWMGQLAGILGMVPILLDLLLQIGFVLFGVRQAPPGWIAGVQTFLAGFSILVGIWMAITGHLGLATKTMPAALGIAGLVAGVSRVIIVGNLVLGAFSTFPQVALSDLWNLGLVVWIASHLVWTTWLGLWLLAKRVL